MINQRSLRNWRFATLVEAKAVANANEQTLCYCDETETLYRYHATSGATADDKFVLVTGGPVASRWLGIAGKYVYPVSGAPFGEMYLSATSAVAVNQYPSFTELGGTTALGDATSFDMVGNNRLRYIGVRTRKFRISVSLSASSSGPDTYRFRIAKTGADIAKSCIPRYMSGVSDTGAIALSCVADLAQNDYVGVWAARISAAAKNVTMESVNVIASAID